MLPLIARFALALCLVLCGVCLAHAQTPATTLTAPAVSASPWRAKPSVGARVELSLAAIPLGAGFGDMICGLKVCSEPRPWAAATLFGAAGAATLAAVGTREGIRFSAAQAIEGGAFFGLVTPVYLWTASTGARGNVKGLLSGMLVGEVLGAGAGYLLERELAPTSGAVALAYSGAIWLPAIGVLLAHTTQFYDSPGGRSAFGASLFGLQVVGLGLGGYLGQKDGVARVQVWLADIGAGVMGGVAPLLTWLIAGDVSSSALLTSSAVGMAAGLVGAYMLATRLPRRGAALARLSGLHDHVQLTASPVRGGATLGVFGRF